MSAVPKQNQSLKMREPQPLRAAPVKTTARMYSIPSRHLYGALRAGELRSHHIAGRSTVLLFAEVDAWIASKGPPSSPFKKSKTLPQWVMQPAASMTGETPCLQKSDATK
jgi:hypothetical protein